MVLKKTIMICLAAVLLLVTAPVVGQRSEQQIRREIDRARHLSDLSLPALQQLIHSCRRNVGCRNDHEKTLFAELLTQIRPPRPRVALNKPKAKALAKKKLVIKKKEVPKKAAPSPTAAAPTTTVVHKLSDEDKKLLDEKLALIEQKIGGLTPAVSGKPAPTPGLLEKALYANTDAVTAINNRMGTVESWVKTLAILGGAGFLLLAIFLGRTYSHSKNLRVTLQNKGII